MRPIVAVLIVLTLLVVVAGGYGIYLVSAAGKTATAPKCTPQPCTPQACVPAPVKTTDVEFCSPYRIVKCPRAGDKLTCAEYWSCLAANKDPAATTDTQCGTSVYRTACGAGTAYYLKANITP